MEAIYFPDVGPSAPAVETKQHASTGKSISEIKPLLGKVGFQVFNLFEGQNPTLVLFFTPSITDFDHSTVPC